MFGVAEREDVGSMLTSTYTPDTSWMADYLDNLSNVSESGGETPRLQDADNIIQQITAAVDTIYTCDPCIENGQSYRAKGYCTDCEEYLCDTCFLHHTTIRPFRRHVLQELNELPREGNKYMPLNQVVIRCSLHPEKKIIYHCKTHDQLCCQTCVTIGHRVCSNVRYVDELGVGIESNEEFKTFYARVLDMEQRFLNEQQTTKAKLDCIEQKYRDIVDVFKAKLDSIRDTDMEKVNAIKSVYETAGEQTGQWIQNLEQHWESKDFGQLFTLYTKTRNHLDMIESNVKQMVTNDPIERYRFSVDSDSDGDCKNLGVLEKGIRLVKKIKVRQSNERFNCVIKDIVLLRKNLMLVTDYGSNCSIKLVDTKRNDILSAIELNSGPWQMTMTDKRQVFVSVPGLRKLLHLRSPTKDVTDIKEIQVNEQCAALEFHENALRMQCVGPCKVVEMDLSGKMQRLVHSDISSATSGNTERFVTHPYCSVLDQHTGSMVVACYSQNSITEITQEGKVKLLVKSDELRSPFGLCIDKDGSFFVSSCGGRNVLRVTRDGDIESVLPEPLKFTPSAIALDTKRRRLYVGGTCNSVLVYEI